MEFSKNQVYRVSTSELKELKDSFKNCEDICLVEIDGTKMAGLDGIDNILNEFIRQFKLQTISPEENYDEQFPDYNSPDPMHGLAYAMRDLTHLTSNPKQTIVVLYHEFYSGLVSESGQLLGSIMSQLLPYYDLNQDTTADYARKTPVDDTRRFDFYLEC